MDGLTRLELATLIAVVRLGHDAYGSALHDDVEMITARPVAQSAVYATLARLQRQHLLSATKSPVLAIPGGKAKRIFAVTQSGRTTLEMEFEQMTRLWWLLPRAMRPGRQSRHQQRHDARGIRPQRGMKQQ